MFREVTSYLVQFDLSCFIKPLHAQGGLLFLVYWQIEYRHKNQPRNLVD